MGSLSEFESHGEGLTSIVIPLSPPSTSGVNYSPFISIRLKHRGLIKDIEKTIDKSPHWSSRADFVKDAVRQLLNYYDEMDLGKVRK